MNSRIVFIADIHIGNTRIPLEHIYYNIRRYLYPKLMNCDIVFFGGDFFHTLLNVESLGAYYAVLIMSEILQLSIEHNFIIRILRGTFTHDRGQNAIFASLATKYTKDDKRLICINSISLEYIEKYDLKILYLPDNLPYKDSNDCVDCIKSMLKDMNWDKVDLVIGHGYFEHVLPHGIPHIPPCTFNYKQFKDIVSGYILMGHVHTHSVYKNIIYTGSFERICHGEEEAKGFLYINKNKDKWKMEFIENKDSTLFVTINLDSESFDDCLNKVHELIKKKFDDYEKGYLRIIHPNSNIRQMLVVELSSIYKDLQISHKGNKEIQSNKLITEFTFKVHEEIVPTEENLPELIFAHLQKINPNSKLITDVIRDMLSQL